MRTPLLILVDTVLALGLANCGSSVVPDRRADAAVSDAPSVVPSPDCATVRATCGASPHMVVRGHAEGLTGVDGDRTVFAVRYADPSILSQYSVVTADATIQGGAFEACVCIPYGANWYPYVAAVVLRPGSTGATSRDVVRGAVNELYATLGDENVSDYLTADALPRTAEMALAATVDRGVTTVAVHGFDPATARHGAWGGLVADERPVTAEVDSVASDVMGTRTFQWRIPGREWPSDALVVVLDANDNHQCDVGDLGARVQLDGRRDLSSLGTPWIQGADVTALCHALIP